MIGQVLGHCRVVAKIGEGGMGVVYRARDEVLHRDVALKVVGTNMRPDSSSSQDLLREARASSALAHPNICTIFEVGEAEGQLYIVMELVEGKSLRALIGEASLPAESVLRYGVQIASALVRAHDKGIVHRDLKSANPDACRSRDKQRLKSVRLFCASCRCLSARRYRSGFGPSFSAAWRRSQRRGINALARFRRLWKPFNRM